MTCYAAIPVSQLPKHPLGQCHRPRLEKRGVSPEVKDHAAGNLRLARGKSGRAHRPDTRLARETMVQCRWKTSEAFMSTVVVGATGATGRLLVDQLISRGETVVAIVRSAERLPERLRNSWT